MSYRKSVTISLPTSLLKQVVRRAKRQQQTTSVLVSVALRRYLDEQAAQDALWRRLRAYGASKALYLGINTEADIQRLVDQHRLERYSRLAISSVCSR